MSGSNNSLILSEKVEAYLNDVAANLKLMMEKELEAQFKNKNTQLEVEKQLLQADREDLESGRLELKADRIQLKREIRELDAIRASLLLDPKKESEKAAPVEERMKLDAEMSQLKVAQSELEKEKTQLKIAQSRLKAAQSVLEDIKSQLEQARTELDEARVQLETARKHLEAAKAEAVVDRERLEDARESLEMAEVRFMAATKQMNAAKIRFESAKSLLDAASVAEKSADHTIGNEDKIAKLEIRICELESERLKSQTTISFMENDKSNLAAELRKSSAEMEKLVIKVREVEKQLEQCCKDKKAMEAEKTKPQVAVDHFAKPKVFLDMGIRGTRVGRIVIKLDYDITPRTAEKFRELCTGQKGTAPYYKGRTFNIYGGCIAINYDLKEDMYGSDFPAENITKKHVPGAVSLVFVNGSVEKSRFIIGTDYFPHYDGKFVVFGHVIEGMNIVMEIAEKREGSVIECGELP